ncbi:MAG: FHA domain-containing protein [Prevotella sp.]|nr:FHA domain-containing protein [Prevotella sp.]
MEIVIGRDASTSRLKLVADGKTMLAEAEGAVPPTVADAHCSLTFTSEGIRLRNLDINHYTYVNGKGVEAKKVSKTDHIELGLDHFPVDWNIIAMVAPADVSPLCRVWDQYEQQKLELQIAERRFNSLRSATGLLTMVAIALSVMTGRQSLGYIVLYATAILVSLAFTIKAWNNAASVPQKTAQLTQQFQHDYVCPCCGRFLGGQSPQMLAQSGHCPYCKKQFIL